MKPIWKKITRTLSKYLFLIMVLIIGQVSSGQQNPTVPKTVHYDYPDEQGELTGGIIVVEANDIEPHVIVLQDIECETIINNGPTSNRVDIVFVGDGYQEQELDVYETDVINIINGFFAESPLNEYASYFNVHRVDVISTDSGVDNDPIEGIERDTALNMQFWTYGVERLLGWDPIEEVELLVMPMADIAPDRDYVLAVANSAKYGGAGYIDDDLGTVCGHEEFGQTNGIALHESGHAFAKLDDEYFTNGEVYDPFDVLDLQANTSIVPADEMAAQQQQPYKWILWLGEPTIPPEHAPDGISTYDGATVLNISRNPPLGVYVAYIEGVYRSTEWSMMRELYQDPPFFLNLFPFHQVNAEQFIFKIYEIVHPIDDATPPGIYPVSTVFFVEPLQPSTHNLDVQWYLGDDPPILIPEATETTFDASTLGLSPGTYTLSAVVVDKTDMVRDEILRAGLMSETREWTLQFNDSSHLNDTSKFYVKNAAGENVAWFGDLGNIVLRGTLTSGEIIDTAPPGSFIIQDSTNDTVAYIDNEGNLCIEGSELSGSCNPAGDAFIIKSSSDAIVSYIDFTNGDLCLTGDLIDYSNP